MLFGCSIQVKMSQSRVFYKGTNEDFVVFLDDPEALDKYKTDSTIPLSQVLGNFDVYKSITGGATGVLDKASKQELAEEFGDYKSVEDDIIKKILAEGHIQHSQSMAKGKKSIDGGLNREKMF